MDVHIVRFVRHIALTYDTELDCEQCSQLTPGYVDALVLRQEMSHWEMVRTHLIQCPVCAEEVEQLHRIVQIEFEDGWSRLNSLLEGWT